jgi:hypothetical protein
VIRNSEEDPEMQRAMEESKRAFEEQEKRK